MFVWYLCTRAAQNKWPAGIGTHCVRNPMRRRGLAHRNSTFRVIIVHLTLVEIIAALLCASLSFISRSHWRRFCLQKDAAWAKRSSARNKVFEYAQLDVPLNNSPVMQ